MSKRFMGLTPKQTEVLGHIAMNNDRGHHPATLTALLNRCLIERHEVRAPNERLPFYDVHYTVPLGVHMAYCQWCDDNFNEDGSEKAAS
jgi:hypothetical protein